jgi:poly(hydroxyalkanoate) granule-associated protein
MHFLEGTIMAKKSAKHENADDTRFVEAVRQSVERIWQAGLGAFARAQHEGEEAFSRLVKEGTAIQKRTRNVAEGRLEEMTETITKMSENLGKQASAPLGKLEAVFEDRVTRSLHRIGVPTRDEIEALTSQVGKLQKTVDAALGVKVAKGKPKTAVSSVGKKAATTKSAATRTATRAGIKRGAANGAGHA